MAEPSLAPIAWLADPWPSGGASLPAGHWGPPDQLALPLSDRGLTLADGLFETVLVEGGRPRLLAQHLARWQAAAALLAMAAPPREALLLPLIVQAVVRSGILLTVPAKPAEVSPASLPAKG